MNETKNYTCEKCSYTTAVKQKYETHLMSQKHITGRITRNKPSKDPSSCTICNNYKTKNTFNMQTHILNNHSTASDRKEKYKYYCDVCDFGVFSEDVINKHIQTKKHIRLKQEAFINPFED